MSEEGRKDEGIERRIRGGGKEERKNPLKEGKKEGFVVLMLLTFFALSEKTVGL